MFNLQIQSRDGARARLLSPNNGVTHLITISTDQGPVAGAEYVPHVEHLQFTDMSMPRKFGRFTPPTWGDVERIIQFGRTIGEDDNLLVHCAQGISRSTAAAYIILADRLGAGHEREARQLVQNVRVQARPNRLMVRYADNLLDRKGNLEAWI